MRIKSAFKTPEKAKKSVKKRKNSEKKLSK